MLIQMLSFIAMRLLTTESLPASSLTLPQGKVPPTSLIWKNKLKKENKPRGCESGVTFESPDGRPLAQDLRRCSRAPQIFDQTLFNAV